VSLRDAWEENAEAWAAWASTPGHDKFFWLHGLPQLLALLPPAGRRTLDVGCGEGRLIRELERHGHHTLGVEASATLSRLAAKSEHPAVVARGDAAALPFGAGTVDLVVACMSLHDVDDLSGAVRESARVLLPGGRLCASVVHPINSAGAFTTDAPESPFVMTDSYLDERGYVDEMTRDGLSMRFHSRHHSLEGYMRAIEDAGLLLEALREPPASPELVASAPTGARWQRLPVFLFFRAVKPHL